MYGMFTYIYHKNQPFMQVNIPVPWMVWARISQVFFDAQEVRRFVVHARSGILAGLKASLGVSDLYSLKATEDGNFNKTCFENWCQTCQTFFGVWKQGMMNTILNRLVII